MLRERDCEPPAPHDLVQVDQALNAVTTQCAGQLCTLQDCVSSVCGHAAPPLRTAVSMLRERDCTPSVPHTQQMLQLLAFTHSCTTAAEVNAVQVCRATEQYGTLV